jgi:hypothetical protein
LNPVAGQQGQRSSGSKGQALILIAITFLVLLAIVGLTTDVGQLFIFMGHLRQATDSASLAAAGQYREGRGIADMTASAQEAVALNGIDPNIFTVVVNTCETLPSDPQLCTTPRRKLVRVTGQLDVPTIFLQLVGVNTIRISANSIGEAASLDVVLVIDISESMAWDAGMGNPMRDPAACNAADSGGADGYPGECYPFEDVKMNAVSFVNRVLDRTVDKEEDRLAIVTFANGWSNNHDQGTAYRTAGWTNDRAIATDIIKNLKIYQPGECFNPRIDPVGTVNQFWGPCEFYNPDDTFAWLDCLSCRDPSNPLWPVNPPEGWTDWSYLPTTNIGGGLLKAGNMFAYQTKEEALWVVVLLTDGMANATDASTGDDIDDYTTYPVGYCPNPSDTTFPLCQDKDVDTRHSPPADPLYDADDYAHDMADFIGCYPKNPATACNGVTGQGAIIFAIGLGNGVLRSDNEVYNRPYGASLLRYIARVGYVGDPDPNKDPCKDESDYTKWCGNYYYAPHGPQLDRVFEDIASRIFTRLTH